jgi:ATP-binding cassette subfamily E protein 1
VSGILGVNGIGKTTAVKILSGQVMPNLGKSDANIHRIKVGLL